jgi:hypothetical protein
MTFIDTFHIVEVLGSGVSIFIDDGTRKQIEQCVRKNDLISFDDIYGADHTVSILKIASISASSPEIRQSYFEHNQGIDEERKARGDFRED